MLGAEGAAVRVQVPLNPIVTEASKCYLQIQIGFLMVFLLSIMLSDMVSLSITYFYGNIAFNAVLFCLHNYLENQKKKNLT